MPSAPAPVSVRVTSCRPPFGRELFVPASPASKSPLPLRSTYTLPVMAATRISPKSLSIDAPPAGSTMPATALGTVVTGVAVPLGLPPTVPATVMPLEVVYPPTTGCATCSLTV